MAKGFAFFNTFLTLVKVEKKLFKSLAVSFLFITLPTLNKKQRDMKVAFKFDAYIYLEGENMAEIREKFENMPLFSEEALKEGHAEFCELFLVEDAETNKDLMDEYENAYDDEDDEDVVDANGYVIKKGDKVIWTDPETGNKVKYEVYEEPTAEMVKLANKYGECEAFPWECRVIEA